MKRNLKALSGLILLLTVSMFAQDSTSVSLQPFVEGTNRFGLKYLHRLQQENPKDNLLVAPASLSLAFAMLQNGADATANKEIGEVFERANLTVDQVNVASKELLSDLAKSQTWTPNYITSFRISNSLWIKGPDTFRADISKIAQGSYGASTNSLTGVRETDQETMDAFLAKSLGRKFSIATPRLERRREFALVAATIFDGKWDQEFAEAKTTPKDFKLLDHTKRKVDMMWRRDELYYFKGEHFQAVRVEYTGHYGMYVILPDDDDGLGTLVESLTPENWKTWTKSLETKREGTLELPKFEIVMMRNSTEDLVSLGLKTTFGSLKALAKLIDSPDGANLTTVVEDAKLSVNEKRTYIETRAMLGGVIGGIISYLNPPKPFHMIVDHPFLFAVVDGTTRSILYIGVVTQPSASTKTTAKQSE